MYAVCVLELYDKALDEAKDSLYLYKDKEMALYEYYDLKQEYKNNFNGIEEEIIDEHGMIFTIKEEDAFLIKIEFKEFKKLS